jgi:acyl-CoA thioester hydrolase
MAQAGTSVKVQIRFGDIDMARHVHNVVYFHWFELARMSLFRTFIPAGHDWESQGLILARNEIDHLMPVKLHDDIRVDVWCADVGSKSVDLRYEVVRLNDRSGICARGRSVMVCFDHIHHKSIEVPGDWRAALKKSGR